MRTYERSVPIRSAVDAKVYHKGKIVEFDRMFATLRTMDEDTVIRPMGEPLAPQSAKVCSTSGRT